MPLDPAPVIAEAISERTKKPRKSLHKKPKAKKKRVPKLHRPKKESTKTIMARLYKTWSAVVHARSNDRCEVCGAEGKNDAHHVQPRQICSGLRFDPRNGVCLCPSHHKYGHRSAHKGMLWFVDWFKNNRPGDYAVVMENLDKELDCKNRMELYDVEEDLRERYCDAIPPIGHYKVTAYDRKGNKVESVIKAYNNRAAEYIFWQRWPKDEGYEKLKGIYKTEQVEAPSWEEEGNDLARNVAKILSDDFRHNMSQDSIAYKILPPDNK